MAKKILFTGYYGFNNFGDDLFGWACVNGIERLGNEYVPVILSPPISGINAEYLVSERLARLYKKQNIIGSLIRVIYMIYGCLRYRDVVLSGGSVISSGSSLFTRYVQYFFVKLGFCRLSAIGISVGPFSSGKDRNKAKMFINSLNYLTVRDEASLQECRIMGLEVEANLYNDLAGCVPLSTIGNVNIDNKVLGVSVCRYESIIGADVENEILRNRAIFDGLTDFALKNDMKVKIIVLNANEIVGDISISKDLSLYLRQRGVSAEVIDYVNPILTLKVIAECNMFFSVRLHGAISAYLLNVPFILVEYHIKCRDFLDYIGYEQENRITANLTNKRPVQQSLEEIYKHKNKYSLELVKYTEKSNKIFVESPWGREF